MDDAKVFEAKNLDEAIRLACTFFDAPREKLEVEFIQDAKSGIFWSGGRAEGHDPGPTDSAWAGAGQ